MEVKSSLKTFNRENRELFQKLAEMQTHESGLSQKLEMLKENNFNFLLGASLAVGLQLNDSPDEFEQYSLEDIRELFTTLITCQPQNPHFLIEAAHFEWAVMDDRKKATGLIRRAEKLISAQQHSLNELKKDLFQE